MVLELGQVALVDSSREQGGDSTVDRIIDAIIPQKPAPSQERQDAVPSEETAPQDRSPAQPPAPSLEDQFREKIGDELKKGLEGLFK